MHGDIHTGSFGDCHNSVDKPFCCFQGRIEACGLLSCIQKMFLLSRERVG